MVSGALLMEGFIVTAPDTAVGLKGYLIEEMCRMSYLITVGIYRCFNIIFRI